MEITINRLKHSLEVAKKMRDLSIQNPDKYPVNPDEMFILGILHDIGYEFVSKQEDHAKAGGEILKNQGYHYWKEVYYHGIAQQEYDSVPLRLLNYTDMITGPNGENFSVEQRIEDIAKRYGVGSIQEINALSLASSLKIVREPL